MFKIIKRGIKLKKKLIHFYYIFSIAFFSILSCQKTDISKPLLCYVGGTMRPAMEALSKAYEEKTGQKIHIDFSGSGELLVKMQQTEKGDLYVAHDPFLASVMDKEIGAQGWTVAVVRPVIVVSKGNPKNIQGIRDLANPGIRIVLSHPQYSTMGHLVPKMAEKAGIREKLEANIVSRTRGGSAAANTVMVGTSDASIVWQAVAHLRKDKLDAVPIESELCLKKGVDAVTTATFGIIDQGYIRVTLATLKYSKNLKSATAFAEYAASKASSEIWKKFGFNLPLQAKEMGKDQKSIFVHCAAGMRKPVSKLAKEFEQSSDVKVELSYDGSNRLLGQIKLTRKGDIYIAGDADYIEMAQKEGLVKSSRILCYFVPVIMVKKGNPLGIEGLQSLLQKGIKIGQGDVQAAAIGRLTPKILALNSIDLNAWNANVVLSTPTVNELGVAIKLGTVDASVVWRSTAENYRDVSTVVNIPPVKNIIPAVGGAVLTFTKNSHAAASFLAYLTSARGRHVLKKSGYTIERPK
jgi:molybdate transport system substrate-binding protein